jgi:hypothetical protein
MHYTVAASLCVEVKMSIEAKTAAEAQDLFHDNLVVVTDLATDEIDFDVIEDSITAIQGVTVHEERTPPPRRLGFNWLPWRRGSNA